MPLIDRLVGSFWLDNGGLLSMALGSWSGISRARKFGYVEGAWTSEITPNKLSRCSLNAFYFLMLPVLCLL